VDEPSACRRAAPPAVLAGLAALYLIWGSTFLAIKYAVESLPPFLMAGTRFGLAGLLLYGVRRLQGQPRPGAGQWGTALLTGALLLLGGNGLVTWAQQFVPSGSAALVVATTPLWMGLLAWLGYGGGRPGPRLVAGMAVGFAGAALLLKPALGQSSALGALFAILAATLLWSLGSLESRRRAARHDPLLTCGMQMLAGGALMLAAGTTLGEWSALGEKSVSPRSLAAFAYLTVFGSLIGFTTYTWLLRVAAPTAVATHAYVNPLVAVLLGWAFAGEPLGADVLLAAGLILGAVLLITVPRPRPAPAPAEEANRDLADLSRQRLHAPAVRRQPCGSLPAPGGRG
jgi:drug/metabolite transporter (DMT)-like permease